MPLNHVQKDSEGTIFLDEKERAILWSIAHGLYDQQVVDGDGYSDPDVRVAITSLSDYGLIESAPKMDLWNGEFYTWCQLTELGKTYFKIDQAVVQADIMPLALFSWYIAEILWDAKQDKIMRKFFERDDIKMFSRVMKWLEQDGCCVYSSSEDGQGFFLRQNGKSILDRIPRHVLDILKEENILSLSTEMEEKKGIRVVKTEHDSFIYWKWDKYNDFSLKQSRSGLYAKLYPLFSKFDNLEFSLAA